MSFELEKGVTVGIVGPKPRGRFSFNCWLGINDYSITCTVHSRNREAFDWLDGARFFPVTSEAVTEGLTNLNASASARHVESAAALSAQK